MDGEILRGRQVVEILRLMAQIWRRLADVGHSSHCRTSDLIAGDVGHQSKPDSALIQISGFDLIWN